MPVPTPEGAAECVVSNPDDVTQETSVINAGAKNGQMRASSLHNCKTGVPPSPSISALCVAAAAAAVRDVQHTASQQQMEGPDWCAATHTDTAAGPPKCNAKQQVRVHKGCPQGGGIGRLHTHAHVNAHTHTTLQGRCKGTVPNNNWSCLLFGDLPGTSRDTLASRLGATKPLHGQ